MPSPEMPRSMHSARAERTPRSAREFRSARSSGGLRLDQANVMEVVRSFLTPSRGNLSGRRRKSFGRVPSDDFEDAELGGSRCRRILQTEAVHSKAPKPVIVGAPAQRHGHIRDNTIDQSLVRSHVEEYDEEEKLRKEDTKQRIVNGDEDNEVTTMVDLLNVADREIEDDWLGEALPGSLYRVLAFQGIFRDDDAFMGNNWREYNISLMKFVFAICVVMIQWCAPPYIFFAQIYHWDHNGTMEVKRQLLIERWHPSVSEWLVMPMTKFLQTIFILVFLLNALWILLDDHKCFRQLDYLWDYLDRLTDIEFHGEHWLWLGGVTHCWLVLWTVCAHFILIGSCTNAKDVVFDSLGMLFLYNLDDIGGDLGFLDEDDWKGRHLKWIYDEMVESEWPPEIDVGGERSPHPVTMACHCLYHVTTFVMIVLLFLLPILSVITPWHAMMASFGADA